MGVTAAIIGSVVAAGSTTYAAVSANQRSQDAKGEAAKALANAPDPAKEAAAAQAKANQAAEKQRKQALNAQGFSDTILTGPQGAPGTTSTGAGHSTLLGL